MIERVDHFGLFERGEAVGLMRLVWGVARSGVDALDAQFLDPATRCWVSDGEVLAELFDAGSGAQQVTDAEANEIAERVRGDLDLS